MKHRWSDLLMVNVRLCANELWSNRMRSVITSFGIFLGVASLLVNMAFIRAMDDNLRKSMEEIGGLSIVTLKTKEAGNDQEKIIFGQSQGLRLAEAERIAAEYPYVRAVLPQTELPWGRISARGKTTRGHAMAVGPEHLRAYNYRIASGRAFSLEDHLARQYVCLMGKRAVNRLFENEDPVGQQVIINRIPFTVIGVIHTEDEFSSRAREILIPYSVYTYRFAARSRKIDEIALELRSSDYVDRALRDFASMIKTLHRGIEDIEVVANQDKIEEMKTAALGMKVLLVTIAVITLLVGGISIMNIMFATIGDRIREIGIRKALGARSSDVFMQFLIEAVTLCMVGGFPGLLLGTTVTLLPEGVFPFIPRLAVIDYSIAVVFTILAGVCSGMVPAMRAADMEPVDALRY